MDDFKQDLTNTCFTQRLASYRRCVLSWVSLRRRIKQLSAMASIYLSPKSELYHEIKNLKKNTPIMSGDYQEASRRYRQLYLALDDELTKAGF